jgi:hypothetical protein
MAGPINSETIVVATNKQVSCDLADEAAILNLTSGIYYGLDRVGVSIWRLVQRPISFSEIQTQLLSEYDAAPEQIKKDLTQLLEKMAAEGLIELK